MRWRTHVLLALAATAAMLAGCGNGSGDQAGNGPTFAPLTTAPAGRPAEAVPASDVLALVRASTTITSVPKDLTPSLVAAGDDHMTDVCHAGQPETTVQTCAYGDLASRKTVVLYGDSHAGMWLPAMIGYAQRAHERLVMLEKTGCPAPDIGFWDYQDKRANTECDTWHGWAMNKINTLQPVLTVVTSLTDQNADAHDKIIPAADYFAGLHKTIATLAPASKRIVYLGDMPYLAQIAPDCLAAHQSAVQACSTARSQAVSATTAYINAHAPSLGAPLVDPTPWLCTASTCAAVVGKYLVYRNQFHITDTYSRFLSGSLGAALGPN